MKKREPADLVAGEIVGAAMNQGTDLVGALEFIGKRLEGKPLAEQIQILDLAVLIGATLAGLRGGLPTAAEMEIIQDRFILVSREVNE